MRALFTIVLTTIIFITAMSSFGYPSANSISDRIRLPSSDEFNNNSKIYLDFEERLIVSYILQSQMLDLKDQQIVLDKLKKIILNKLSMPIETVVVKSFEEFLNRSQAGWPDTSSLKVDLDIIEKQSIQPFKKYVSDNAKVQKKINQYRSNKVNYFKNILNQKSKLLDLDLLSLISDFNHQIQGPAQSQDQINKTISNVKNLFSISTESIFKNLIHNLDSMGDLIANELENNKAEINPVFKKILKTVFSEYFKQLSLDSKKQILSSMLSLPINVDDQARFVMLVQNSGPVFQKFLQILGTQKNIPHEMLELFKILESSVRPVPWIEVQKIIDFEKDNYSFVSVEKKPLGVGTMAQVHRAKMSVDGKVKSVVLRFIKPRISERVIEDEVILKNIADILDRDPLLAQSGLPKVTPVIEDIIKSVMDELDIKSTIDRQIKAQHSYNNKLFIKGRNYKNILETHVPEIYLPLKSSSELMVQELVFGTKLDKVVNQYYQLEPQLKRLISEAIAKMWIQETFFGNGFYHSDLHQGNFLVSVKDSHIQVNMLDFGMGGFVDRKTQNKFLVLGMALESLDAEFISQIFWELSVHSDNKISYVDLNKFIRDKIKILNGKNITMTEWLGFVMNCGLKMKYEVINLNRGITIQNQMLIESGSSKNLTSIVREIILTHPQEFFQRIVTEEKVNFDLLAKISWLEIKNVYSKFNENKLQQKQNKKNTLTCENLF